MTPLATATSASPAWKYAMKSNWSSAGSPDAGSRLLDLQRKGQKAPDLQLGDEWPPAGCDSSFCKGCLRTQNTGSIRLPKKRREKSKPWNRMPGGPCGAKILSEVKEWRKAHPKATFVEIEDEMHRRMVQLEAELLQDTAQESSSRTWGKETGREVPRCPTCQVPLQARGQHARTVPGNGGESVTRLSHLWNLPELRGAFFPPR